MTSAEADLARVTEQLGRPARGMVAVAARCSCGEPLVVETLPRLPDGTPFPTVFYLTCPNATARVSTLESQGVMREMQDELATDTELAQQYLRAHEHYLARRAALGDVPEIDGISAGGMPNRVKCLHVLVGHSLAAGPGVNLFGDRAIALLQGSDPEAGWDGRWECDHVEADPGEPAPVSAGSDTADGGSEGRS